MTVPPANIYDKYTVGALCALLIMGPGVWLLLDDTDGIKPAFIGALFYLLGRVDAVRANLPKPPGDIGETG